MHTVQRFLVYSFIFISRLAFADCTTIPNFSGLPTGKQGQISMSVAPAKLMYCDGTTWKDFGGTPTATPCTINGQINMASGELQYCNNSVIWPVDSGATTNGSCSTSGTFQFNSVTSKFEYCNGTDWRVVDDDPNPDTFAFTTLTGGSWQAAFIANSRRVTGFTGGTGTWTASGTTCNNYGYRVCADSGCAQTIVSGNFTTTTTSYIPNGAWVRASFTSATTPNETCSVTLQIGSVTTAYSVTTGTTDNNPASFTWTPVRSASPSAVVNSNIVRMNGHSGVTGTISDMGTGGSPEFRVCQDAACSTELITWSTGPQSIGLGHYVQLRTTMSAATHSVRRAQLTAGGTSAAWYVTTGTCNVISLAAGATTTCTCGAGTAALNLGVIGTSGYTQSSDACSAAIHAGAISDAAGGSITLRGVGATNCPSFTGSTANGVTSTSSASSASAFYIPSVASDPCP